METPVTLAGLFAQLDALRQALQAGDIDRLGRLVGEYRSGIDAFIALPAPVTPARYDELDRLLQAHLQMQDILSAARGMIADHGPASRRFGRPASMQARVSRP